MQHCLKCKGVLLVTHSYSQPGSKFQRAVCQLCKRVHCVTSVVTIELMTRPGQGAESRAANLRNGVALGDVQGLTKIRRKHKPKAGVAGPAAAP